MVAWLAQDATLPATFAEVSDSEYRIPWGGDTDVEPEETPSSPTAHPADNAGSSEAVEAAIKYTVADIVDAGCFIPKTILRPSSRIGGKEEPHPATWQDQRPAGAGWATAGKCPDQLHIYRYYGG
ncbi:hypothetical protein [Corynebacterium pseudopelargi]|uniref:Uncharacterized protein n=1 Tax=Corynebacterium pseudopelargi TaxID=2080757 RepID=A0A3G6IWQ9_9CORY|nr:hypothetical protein [Corynebacterium pseudopelargi]AZA08530.1 hypothetical protein CPPEL_01920 [Corynebacterium pseudopelargi]